MKDNKLIIVINKPLADVFTFCITPPKAKLWVPHIIDEKQMSGLLRLAQFIWNTKMTTPHLA
jgi:hypothetical protein